MTRHPERVADYIEHILDAIARIQQYTTGMDESCFLASEITQDAVIRNLEVIGEASNHIRQADPEFESRYAGIPLAFAYEMRNVLAHGYFQIDLAIVWRTLENDLPELQASLREIMNLGLR